MIWWFTESFFFWVLIVEGLANLHMLNEKQEYFLVVAPLKLEGCSGAPVRAFAITL